MSDDELDGEDRALIARLRALPPEGNEPDWHALEASIRSRVAGAAPRPWWRNWRWIVPIWALTTTAAVGLVVLHGHDAPRAPTAVFHVPTLKIERSPAPSMWLDGEAVDLGDIDEPALDDLDRDARAALQPDDDVGGLLPVADYHWVDALDDEGLQRADTWLKRNRS